ncbi:MAG: DUF4158 domain-containing protein [Chloroflexi bacterium]|nr:DUF4158 domain-containing protein [Chloroflexota bacterium]
MGGTTMQQQWTRDELADHSTLSPNELELLANKSGATRLGFAVLLKAFTLEGRFPRQKHDVPGVVVVHIANQVNVAADLYPRYEWSGRTIEYHPAQIRDFLGFHEATVHDANALVAWLAQQVLPQEPREDHVREALFERCRALRIEPPSSGRVDRLVRSAFRGFEERWCAAVLERLDGATQRALDDLLMTGGADDDTNAEATETRRSGLNQLKDDAGAISLDSVLAEIAKLERLRGLGLPTDVFRDVSLKVVERFRQRSAAEAPNELRAHAPALRATLVASLCWLRKRGSHRQPGRPPHSGHPQDQRPRREASREGIAGRCKEDHGQGQCALPHRRGLGRTARWACARRGLSGGWR